MWERRDISSLLSPGTPVWASGQESFLLLQQRMLFTSREQERMPLSSDKCWPQIFPPTQSCIPTAMQLASWDKYFCFLEILSYVVPQFPLWTSLPQSTLLLCARRWKGEQGNKPGNIEFSLPHILSWDKDECVPFLPAWSNLKSPIWGLPEQSYKIWLWGSPSECF